MKSWIRPSMWRSIEGHVLEQALDANGFKAFYLRKPEGGRMMSTLLVFTPEGIVITGDVRPTREGNASSLGYGVDWFAGALGEDYLCSKFLKKGWHAELAAEELRDMAASVLAGRMDDWPWSAGLRAASEWRAAAVEDLRDRRESVATAPSRRIDPWVEQARETARTARDKVRALRRTVAERLETLAVKADAGELEPFEFHRAYREVDPDSEDLPGHGYDPAEAGWLCAIQKRFAQLYKAPVPA